MTLRLKKRKCLHNVFVFVLFHTFSFSQPQSHIKVQKHRCLCLETQSRNATLRYTILCFWLHTVFWFWTSGYTSASLTEICACKINYCRFLCLVTQFHNSSYCMKHNHMFRCKSSHIHNCEHTRVNT